MKLLIISAIFTISVSASAQEAAVVSNECVRVTAATATLRGRPSVNGKALDVVTKNEQLESIAKRDAWVLVQADDFTGWIEAKWLESCIAGTVSKTPVLGPAPAAVTPPTAAPAVAAAQNTPSDSRTYTKGSRGGCYYINSSGRKVYVDHGLCN
jgi:hypothetical protein